MKAPIPTEAGVTRTAPSPDAETRTGVESIVVLPHAQSNQAVSPTPVRSFERYELVAEHGRGGLGRVSRAHDRELGRDVAIKELINRTHISEVRFLREALITARLEHPGIVPVHEAGRWPDGTPFYAMKLVAGRPLRDLIAERSTVEQRLALLHHVIAVADAIAYAHGRNIIHRDLKPANVIVGDFGETIVIDWGLAKDLSLPDLPGGSGDDRPPSPDAGLTNTGTILGTPAYMAPEQARGENVDQRADVFAIGAMLWELSALQRVPPDEVHLRHRILRGAGIAPDLVTIIDKALARDPARRYPDAGALAADLKAFKAGARIAARDYSLPAVLVHWTRQHRALAFSVCVALLAASTTAIFYIRGIRREQRRTQTTLMLAERERDRAKLAEASLILEKDPTTARPIVAALEPHTIQWALMQSRVNQTAAEDLGHLPGSPLPSFLDVAGGRVLTTTINGYLVSTSLTTGQITTLATEAMGPIAAHDNTIFYAKRIHSDRTTTITPLPGTSNIEDIHWSVLADPDSKFLWFQDSLYALSNGVLYKAQGNNLLLIERGVRGIASDDGVFMVCTMSGVLTLTDSTGVPRHDSCAMNPSIHLMAADGGWRAWLRDPSTIVVNHLDSQQEIKTSIRGSYTLAMSKAGVLAVADSNGGAWYKTPTGQQLLPAPSHSASPILSAASGAYVAWGYANGVVVALDTTTGESRELKNPDTYITDLVIDDSRRLITTTAGSEIRTWRLAGAPRTGKLEIHGNIFNISASPDSALFAMDGADGTLRIWDPTNNKISSLHRHQNSAFGVAWLRDLACSGSFDGSVLCSAPGRDTLKILGAHESVRWLTASPDHQQLAMATEDGRVYLYDGSLNLIYQHEARPYRLRFSNDGRYLASGDADGVLCIYDLRLHRKVDTIHAHTKILTAVVWQGDHLWTASMDSTAKRWTISPDSVALERVSWLSGGSRFFHLLKDGWISSAGNQFVEIHRSNGTLRFDAGRHIERIDVSGDYRQAAISISTEIIVLDLERSSVATVDIPSNGISFAGFALDNNLTITTGDELFNIPLNSLSHTTFE